MEVKPIPNTRYLISEEGTVYSSYSNKALKPISDGRGYLAVTLWIDGASEKYKIHRLVAQVFCSNPDNLTEVNHIDGCKTNNRYTNLEWVTHSQNMKHALENGLIRFGSETYISKLDETLVKEIKELMLKGLNNQEIAELYRVARGTISKIRQKKTWKHVLPNLDLPASASQYKPKLSIEQRLEIKKLSKEGLTNSELAKKFKVHNGTIYQIVNK